MYFFVVIFINIVTCQILKLNISIPLSANRQYIDTHIGLFNQLNTNFQSEFNLNFNENPLNDTHVILIGQNYYITPYLVFNVEYRIKPLCRYNNLYLGHIYNCVTKGIYFNNFIL